LIAWLLTQLEKDPTTIFSKRELLKQSEADFRRLQRAGLLTYVQTDPESDAYPCKLPCARTCPMQIVAMQGQFYAICPEDSEIDPILLGENDLHKYAFSIEKFIEDIRKANRLSGNLSQIEPDYSYMGCTLCEGQRVGIVFVPSIGGKGLLELCGLKRLCVDDDVLIVFSPVSASDDISIRAGLSREKVIQTSLAASLDFRTCQIPLSKLVTQAIEAEREQRRLPQTQVPGDELISLTQAGELLSVNKGTVGRLADAGKILDNGQEGQNRQVWKSSVLLLKQQREDEELRNDARELRKDSAGLPDRH